MNKKTLRVLFAVAALATAIAAAQAVAARPPVAASCRDVATARFSDGVIFLRGADAHAAAAGSGIAVIRASYSASAAGSEQRQPEPVGTFPQPGRWTTLLAGLLGVVSMARRRM
jgi:hypothetical protein